MKIKHIKFSVEQIEEAVEEVLNLKTEVERELVKMKLKSLKVKVPLKNKK